MIIFHIFKYGKDYNYCVYEIDARLFEVSLGKLDEFTDHMLNLPSKFYLKGLI